MAVGNKFHYSRCLSESVVIRINLSEFQERVHTSIHTHTRNAVKVKMRMWSQLVNLATLKMCKSSSVACGNTMQSSYLNSTPTEVEYLVNSVTSSLCTTLHTLALLKKRRKQIRNS